MTNRTATITHGSSTAGESKNHLSGCLPERPADRADEAVGNQPRAVIERGGGEALALGFRQRPQPAGDGAAHADAVETGDKSGDEGCGDRGHGLF